MHSVFDWEHPIWPHRVQMNNLGGLLPHHGSPCLEIAFKYLEQDPVFASSGYIKSGLAKRLKVMVEYKLLEPQWKSRFSRLFLNLLERGQHRDEFKAYFRLWETFISLNELQKFDEIILTRPTNTFIKIQQESLHSALEMRTT